MIRLVEEEAAYASKSDRIIPMIKEIVNKHGDENVVILGRYSNQIKNLQRTIGKKIKVIKINKET